MLLQGHHAARWRDPLSCKIQRLHRRAAPDQALPDQALVVLTFAGRWALRAPPSRSLATCYRLADRRKPIERDQNGRPVAIVDEI